MFRKILPGRISLEKKTIRAMMGIYCSAHHAARKLCPECEELLAYATERLDRCVFRDNKPTCLRCPVHCYRPVSRDHMRVVMRYSGPRMMRRHPLLALMHLLQGWIDRFHAPQRPQRSSPT